MHKGHSTSNLEVAPMIERRRKVPEALLAKPQALALWVFFRDHPTKSVKEAAETLNISRRWAQMTEKWLVQNGFIIEIRYGKFGKLKHERKAYDPATVPVDERRSLLS